MTADNLPGKLLLNLRETAATLGVSTKTVWNMTSPRGTLRPTRIGARVLYAVEDLRAWIDQHKWANRTESAN